MKSKLRDDRLCRGTDGRNQSRPAGQRGEDMRRTRRGEGHDGVGSGVGSGSGTGFLAAIRG